jgi:cellulose synthase operon protein C
MKVSIGLSMRNRRLSALLLVASLFFCFSTACTRDPKVRKQKYLDSGNAYMKNNKYREAIIEYANAVKIEPGDANAHYLLAQAYMKAQVWNGAFVELTRTVEIQPGLVPAQLDLGNLYLAGRKTAEARQKAKLILDKDPKNAGAYALLANVEAAENRFDEALSQMQKAIDTAPDNPQYYLNLAVLQVNKKDLAGAEATAKKSLQIKSTEDGHQFLGGLYAQQQRWPDAEQEFKAAVAAAPDSMAARVHLANLYVAEQKNDAAEQTMIDAKKTLGKDAQSYMVLADYYLGRGQTDKGLAELASVSQDHPKDLPIKKRYAEVLLLTNHDADAQKITDAILKNNPKDLEGIIFRSALQLKRGNSSDAVQGLQLAVKTDTTNAFAHFLLGQAYRANGENERAMPELKEAVRLNPRLILAQRAIADLAIARNDVDGLTAAAEAMIKALPYAPDGYLNRAVAEMSRNELDKAEADIQKAIQVAPKDPLGYTRLAILKIRQKKLPDAQKYFEQALSVAPGNSDALRNYVDLLLSQKQTDKAMALVRAQVEKSPNTAATYVTLGIMQAQAKDYAGAQTSLHKAIELDQNSMEAFGILGQVQVAAGSVDDAVKSWEVWMQKNPKDVRPYIMLSGLEQQRNNWQRAQQLLQKAMEIHPDSAVAANNLAYLMLEHGGNVDVALSLAQTARRQAPDSPNIADTLGVAYFKKGVYSSSIDLFEEAAKKQPDNASVQYHLGFAYEKASKSAQAREHLEKALKLDPKSSDAGEAKKSLQQLGRG